MRRTLVAVALPLGLAVAPLALAKTVTAAPAPTPSAHAAIVHHAKLEPKSGSKVTGTATFKDADGKTTLTVSIEGAAPGPHAVHIHEKGDCSDPEAKSAGGHWNPTTQQHGQWGAPMHHLGDIGNITVGADGKGTITLTTDKWSFGGGANDPTGKAIVVHANVDDFKTQPTGNAGGRVACGVIEMQARQTTPAVPATPPPAKK